jgi:hypothetical protein
MRNPGPSSEEILESVKRIKNPSSKLRRRTCPHCSWKWYPNKKKPTKCPHCKRDLNPEAKVNVAQVRTVYNWKELLNGNRFTPANMRELVNAKAYHYKGIPMNMPSLTAGREVQRLANLKLADRYIMSNLGQTKFGKIFKFRERAAINFRLAKGFKMLAEYGSFVLTQKGREKIAELKNRAEIEGEKKLRGL